MFAHLLEQSVESTRPLKFTPSLGEPLTPFVQAPSTVHPAAHEVAQRVPQARAVQETIAKSVHRSTRVDGIRERVGAAVKGAVAIRAHCPTVRRVLADRDTQDLSAVSIAHVQVPRAQRPRITQAQRIPRRSPGA